MPIDLARLGEIACSIFLVLTLGPAAILVLSLWVGFVMETCASLIRRNKTKPKGDQ